VGVQPDFAGIDFADALDQQVRSALFQDDAGSAQLHGLHELVLVLRGGEHDDAGLVLAGLQPLQRGQTVEAGHFKVQQQDIGLMRLQHVQNLPAILRLRDDLEIRLQSEQAAQAVAEYGVVVRHHDANLPGFGRRG
jgi:hypothetical protein